MSDNQYTFANLPSEKVMELCEKSRAAIQKRVDDNVEKHIAVLMNRRFFRCKTREKAIEVLNKTDVHFGTSKWDRINSPFWAEEAMLRLSRINRLANMAPTVSIGAEDTHLF